MPWAELAWRRADLPAGLAALARIAGIVPTAAAMAHAGRSRTNAGVIIWGDLDNWLARCAGDVGIRMEVVGARYPQLRRMLRSAAPAVLRIETAGRELFLLLTGSRGDALRALGPDLAQHSIPCRDIVEALTGDLVAGLPTDIDACISDAGIPPKRRARAREGCC